MQNVLIDTLIKNPSLTKKPYRPSENLKSGNASFMDILSSRMKADNVNGKNDFESLENKKKRDVTFISPKEQIPVKANEENSQISDKSGHNLKKVESKDEIREKEEPDEDRNTLESMILLLRSILSVLDGNVRLTEEGNTDGESITPMENFSAADIVKALTSMDINELKDLVSNTTDKSIKSELCDFLNTIQQIIGDNQNINSDMNGSYSFENASLSPEQVMKQLKSQCNELIQKLQQKLSEAKTTGETIGQMPKLTANNNSNSQDSLRSTEELNDANSNSEDISIGSAQQTGEDASVKSTTKTEGKGTDKDNTSQENPKGVMEDEILGEQQHKIAKSDYRHDFVLVTDQSSQPVTHVRQTQLSLPTKVMSQSVTNQVMMKVKLMAGDNKQEMEMHLEPEALGKLSLRIIHEKGEILAKITAESEQVKQILESNMQMLKDSLEKNGFSVQSLSVSVGNGKKEQTGQEQTQNSNRNKVSEIKVTEKISEPLLAPEVLYTSGIPNYLHDSSQINLTA